MAIQKISINHSNNLLGISPKELNFSFVADKEEDYIVLIYEENNLAFEKNVSLSEAYSISIDYDFKYGHKYLYVVKSSEDKKELEFETAIKLENNFIKPSINLFAPVFVRHFNLKEKIKEARLYITGLGIYRAFINDNKVGSSYLTPGYNDYDAYLRYQTYDVSDLLKENNKLEIKMGDGWYKGRFGIDKPIDNGDKVFGDEYKLCLELHLKYQNGDQEIIKSDEDFKCRESYCIANNIYDGEEYDYNKDISKLFDVIKYEEKYNLIPDSSSPIVLKEVLKPELYISPKGEKILDFKQNMVGFVKFKANIKKGQKVTLKYGEVLQKECFYNANLRTAKALFSVVGDGISNEFEPLFTFYGFRYVLVEGLDEINVDDFLGINIYSDLETIINVKTDNAKINQLMHNALWGQKGNFLDVPTDCPQRDERLGWTADTQVFVDTACFQMDSYNFYRKYLDDLRYDQINYYNGDIPMYSPSLKGEAGNGGAVWADAGVIIPWKIYEQYGDKKLLAKAYLMMKDYVQTLFKKDQEQGSRNIILYGFTFGDWLAQDGVCAQSLSGGTDTGFINAVYYYNAVSIIEKASKELEYDEDYKLFNEKKNKIYNAILDEFFAPNGKLALDTQTSYVLSLYYGIYRNKERIIQDFKTRLSKDFYKMKTGFTGTPLILNCLFENGMADDAYRILFNEECPGWLYAVNLGATTIWERWNSLLEDGTISGINMNSLNHYSYGSVCEAIYSKIAGLNRTGIAWKEVTIKPQLNYRLKHIELDFESPSGKFHIDYNIKGQLFELNLIIPQGVLAHLELPDGKREELVGGNYSYTQQLDLNITNPFSLDTPNLDILNNLEARKAMETYIPNAYYMVTGENEEFKINNGRFLSFLKMFGTTPESIKKYEEALKKIRP